jgi:hypothetical protein
MSRQADNEWRLCLCEEVYGKPKRRCRYSWSLEMWLDAAFFSGRGHRI